MVILITLSNLILTPTLEWPAENEKKKNKERGISQQMKK